MPFSPADRAHLLATDGVTARVVEQLESIGMAHLPVLAAQEAGFLSAEIARRNGLCIRCGSVPPDVAVRAAIIAARHRLAAR